MSQEPAGPQIPAQRRNSDRLLVVGAALVAVGFVATVATLMPLFVGSDTLPLPFYLSSLLAPLGLGLILVALWRRSRDRSRRLHRVDEPRTTIDGPV